MFTAIKLLCNASLYISTTISFVEYVVQSREISDHVKSIIKFQTQPFLEKLILGKSSFLDMKF